MSRLELIPDIIAINKDGEACHPFKGLIGPKCGYFNYTLSTTDSTSFVAISDLELRHMIEDGEFNERGRVRMVPANATSTSGASALSVGRYMGRVLPL